MKKYIYILLAFALSVACTKEPGFGEVDPADPDDGPMVTLSFSLPPQTKGTMTHDPTISTIHVAVFNKAGVLKQYEAAELTNPSNLTNGDNATDGNPTYSVDIHMSAKPRILHFIADSPVTTYEDLVSLAGTTGEETILNALTTTGGVTAYWQRFELDKIDAYKYQGGVYNAPGGGSFGSEGATFYTYTDAGNTITVNAGDYIKANGYKVLDGTGYFQSDYVKGIISNIPFVRNFAEITVSEDASAVGHNFTPKKFALVNVPTKGYVAPYHASAGKFAEAYTGCTATGFEGLSYTYVHDTGYPGTMAGDLNTACPTYPDDFIDLTGSGVHAAYMYERPLPSTGQEPTCILVGGEYNDPEAVTGTDGLTWLMIEVNKDEAYFPIYRGLSFDIKIAKVEGTKGYASPQAAYEADAIGDISSSISTRTLTQINDGYGTTLWVQYIDYVSTEAEEKELYYTMYYTDPYTGDVTSLNDNLSVTLSHPDESYEAVLDVDTSDTAVYTTGTPDNTKEWRKVTVSLDSPGTTTKRSVLRIGGHVHNSLIKSLYREVNYRVMSIQQFAYGTNVLNATPLASEAKAQETTLNIYLPSDLGYSIFPLTLCIEAENGGFTTVDNLPVETGESFFGTGKNAFYFLKTISYSEYTAATDNLFTARFKTTRVGTTTVAGTNATRFAVVDKVNNGRSSSYFDLATCNVIVGTSHVFSVSPATKNVTWNATTASFSVVSSSGGTWSLSTSSSGVTVNPSSGNGNHDITVTFPQNSSTSSTQTYTVTASLDGYFDQTFTITQAVKPTTTYQVDVLTRSWTTNTSSSYASATNLPGTSGTSSTYTANSAGGNSSIQLRSTSSSGVVTTSSGGIVKYITVNWNSNTADSRVLQVYAKNTAYTDPSDLYDSSTQGTLIATFTCSDGNDTFTLPEGTNYKYIGFRSSSGALYLDEVDIAWDPDGTASAGTVTFTQPTGGTITASAGSSSISSGASVTEGTLVTLTATPADANYSFASWTVNGATVSDASATSATFTMGADNVTVSATFTDNSSHAGTATDPYTAAEAASHASEGTSGVYVKGIVSSIATDYSSIYGNVSLWISDDGTSGTTQFQLFRAPATSSTQYEVGDAVLFTGTLYLYSSSTPELAQGNSMVAHVKAPTFSPTTTSFSTPTSVTLSVSSYEGNAQAPTIYYTTDGSTPTTSSTQYSSEITLTATTTIKAIAVSTTTTGVTLTTGVVSKTYTESGGGGTTTVNDVLNLSFTGVSASTTYAEWSGKTGTSGAVYAGQSAGDHSSIQLRSNNSNSGIVTTTSGGNVKKVVVSWNSNTTSGRTLNVYGKNTAYSAATDLYNTSTQGTLLGTIVYGTSTELTISGDYEYIGLRSSSGAMYLESITITWEQ